MRTRAGAAKARLTKFTQENIDIKALFLPVLLSLLAPAAFAGGVSYDCEVKSHTRNGWIPPRVLLQVDEAAGKVGVFDGLIKEVQGAPLVLPYEANSKGKVKLRWKVKDAPALRGSIPVTFSGSFEPSNGKLRLRAIVHGADNTPSGTGKCQPAKFTLFQ
ncbi:hypothetical protein [Cribrihabitans pelagius]|uniref:hypothetical protein n=1 Tax=Cribrihabitans pelagius TaxID=1765746 RepID=UPI003B5A6687